MKKELTKTALLAASMALFSCVFAQADEEESSLTVNTGYKISARRGGSGDDNSAWDFTAIGFTTTGTVSSAALTSTGETGGESLTTSSNNLYFTGGSVTFTSASISAPTASSGVISTKYAFVVENGSVTFDNTTISELGLNLCIGTAANSTGTLNITNGASVTTSAYYSTVGANGSTGTINISGSNSVLATQQITLGGATSALTAASETSGYGYYYPKYLMSDETYSSIVSAITSTESVSNATGNINIANGGTMTVGVGNTNTSTNKLQIMNGTVTVDGSGSSLVMGENTRLNVQGNYSSTSTTFSSNLVVTNGGSVVNADGTTMASISVGSTNNGSAQNATISVSGTDSSLNLATSNYIVLGSIGDYTATSSATSTVNITASDSANLSLTTAGCFYILDEYSDYETGAQTVNISASGGATMTLAANGESNSYMLIGYSGDKAGSTTDTINISATGSETKLNISSTSGTYIGDTNSSSSGVTTTVSITEGATLATEGTVYVCDDATITVSSSSTWSSDAVALSYDSSVTIDSSSSWTSYGEISLADDSVLNLSVDADGNTSSVSASSISLSDGTIVLSIPEPSAFGLLAGVGALAFVAARRRRWRVA